MSGNHNTKSNDDERLLNAELLVDHWMGRYYAAAKELDRAMDLLHHAETEMRYAGWATHVADNPRRADVYEAIKGFLK